MNKKISMPSEIINKKQIDIIVPVYNEFENIPLFTEAIEQVFLNGNYTYRIYFVDDGSKDDSLSLIREISDKNQHIKYISFSRNFGKDAAMQAGLHMSKGEAAITIDADLQHPIEMIPKMLELWEEGNDIVYAYREKANEYVGFTHKISAAFFYKILNALSDIEMEDGATDFRLTDQKVVQVLNNFSENEPYFKGLTKWIGFKQFAIPYSPKQRIHGKSKYSKRALLKLAIRGITSFSVKPLSLAIYIGFIIALSSVLYIPYTIYSLVNGLNVSGWASIIVTIAFFGGLQLMILGIIGIYLGKLFINSKNRPHYIVKEKNNDI
jgi:dolichol-phosphate mannosyltransferase